MCDGEGQMNRPSASRAQKRAPEPAAVLVVSSLRNEDCGWEEARSS